MGQDVTIFRQRPVEAMRFDGRNHGEIIAWVRERHAYCDRLDGLLRIKGSPWAATGETYAGPGEWIVRGDRFTVIDHADFTRMYET